MNRSLASLVVLFVAVTAGACSGASSGTATGSVCPTGSTLTYANFGQAFIQTNCSACHGARDNPRLTTAAQVRANRGEIDKVAASGPNATNNAMPQGGDVSDADRKKLGEWLACGAPD